VHAGSSASERDARAFDDPAAIERDATIERYATSSSFGVGLCTPDVKDFDEAAICATERVHDSYGYRVNHALRECLHCASNDLQAMQSSEIRFCWP